MARQGTPDAGLALMAQRIFAGGAYTLVAYTNAQNSLDSSAVLSTLIQPSQTNGYSPILLDGVWSVLAGVATYVHSAGASNDGLGNPCWYATGGWSAAVTGVAMVFGSVVQFFVDLKDGNGDPTTFLAAAGKKLATNCGQLASP